MEDVVVDRDKSVSLIRLSNKPENGKCIEPEENNSSLQPNSSSLNASCTDIVTTPDTDRERQRKSQTRIRILIGLVITAVWILIVGLPILFYHVPQVRPHPASLNDIVTMSLRKF